MPGFPPHSAGPFLSPPCPDSPGYPHSLPSPEGRFALDPLEPQLPVGQAGQTPVYMYILSASAQPPPVASTTPAQGERPCQSGPIGLHSAPPLPAGLASWPLCVPTPKGPGASGQKARVGFALFCSSDSTSLLHHFPLVPVRVWGLGKRADLCSYFHTFSVLSGVESFPPLPSPPPVTLWLGECLCMFPSPWWEIVWLNPPLPPWSPGVWNGGGICLKRQFYYNKVYFYKTHAGL